MEQSSTFAEGRPLWNILAEAAHLLESNPEETARQALEALKRAPGQQHALQLLVDSYRTRGDSAGAVTALEQMAAEVPEIAAVHHELGLLLADLGEWERAVTALSRTVELEPKHPQAWRALADARLRRGDAEGAATAYARQFASSITDLKTLEQVSAPQFEQPEIAEDVLREYLNIYATDLAALDALGQLYLRANQYESAEKLFQRMLDLDPSYDRARLAYISALHHQLRPEDESRQIDILLQSDPDNVEYRVMKAVAMSDSGRVPEALRCCEEILAEHPELPKAWLTYAHALRAAARQQECVAAYRKALELDPDLGQAWWGLANLKTFRFEAPDVKAVRAALARDTVSAENRQFLHFALGQALEDAKAYEESFEHYAAGNALIRQRNPYDIGKVVEQVPRVKRRYTRAFFETHAGQGSASRAPIFILGMPRSGSTLVEQILASHSLVEGAGELPSLIALIRSLEDGAEGDHSEPAEYDVFHGRDPKVLGEDYLERSRAHRRSERPCFTDKMPTNFRHVGMIAAILPHAKIIDARRHPLACCFSNFKQIFPSPSGPSYDLSDMGRYYRAYVELLAHYDHVLPGRIHRVIYEEMVRDPEAEIRRLLDYCELPFEEQCLRFYETERGIRTISSEQVRRPVYTKSVEQWRNFEPWLGPLKRALGAVAETYPAVPALLESA